MTASLHTAPVAPARPSPAAPKSRTKLPVRKTPRPVPVEGLTRPIDVKIASEWSEWESAYRLVADSYKVRGYEAGVGELRFTPFHALPDTTVFIARHDGRVVATLTLVPDNFLLGLPMECVYADEVRKLRIAGRRLVEVVGLADEDLELSEFVPVFVALLRLLVQHALLQGADTLIISINPRHRAFYRRQLGFVPLGPRRPHPSVQNHPAEAYLLDVPLMQANAPAMFERIFGEELPADALAARRMPDAAVAYFGGRSSQTDVHTVEEVRRLAAAFGGLRRWL